MKYINQVLSGGILPLLLLLAGGYFTVLLGGRILRWSKKGVAAMFSGSAKSAVRALSVALGGTLGVGNIAGVATALLLGGAGAIFWMWVSAFFAMLLKYAETVLALRTRHYDESGRAHGGAPYYITEAFGGGLGKWLAALFALLVVACCFCLGAVLQSNAAAGAMKTAFGIPPFAVGVLFAVVSGVILLCGTRRVEDACSLLVPVVCALFVVASVAVLILRRDALPNAFSAIRMGAFCPESAPSGILGFFTSRAVRYGVARGLVSNEAGCGTAPIAHAAADTKIPAVQGLWGICEVFVDTILLCTLTALSILVSGVPLTGEGIDLALSAYSAVLGDIARPVLALSVLLFAFATVLSWSHYANEALLFLTRRTRSRYVTVPLVAVGVLWGSVGAAELLWELTDLVIALLAIINIAALLAKRREIREETSIFFAPARKTKLKIDKSTKRC